MLKKVKPKNLLCFDAASHTMTMKGLLLTHAIRSFLPSSGQPMTSQFVLLVIGKLSVNVSERFLSSPNSPFLVTLMHVTHSA